jgi:bifunctional UDP-N-acetylglucosamine pyrophosphorylase/glucosamine-1-phosphate N-acetyltransferase
MHRAVARSATTFHTEVLVPPTSIIVEMLISSPLANKCLSGRATMNARDKGMTLPTFVVVLAAGEGTRMRSSRPKPLHHLCGRPMVLYVLEAATHDEVRATVVVVGHGATWVEKALTQRARADVHLTFVEQYEQLGTGHAVSVALPTIENESAGADGDVLILPGDTPLLRASTVGSLLNQHRQSQAALTVLTAFVKDPSGYGRIVRDKDGSVARIIEERDATSAERAITEINTSIMVVRKSLLGPALRRVDRQNAQNQYYLTDLIAVLHDTGHVTQAVLLEDPTEAQGVNDRLQLAEAESVLRTRINERWMKRGVTMWDPDHTYIDADVQLAPEVSLLPGCVLKGHCVVQRGAQLGPHANLTDVYVGENAQVGTVEATSVHVGADATVHSFVVLMPGAKVANSEVVAPFEYRTR